VSVLLAAFVYAVRTSRQRSQQLLADRAHFGVILENASDAIIGESAEGIVQRWNRAAEQIFGYTAQEALGRPLTELIVPAELIAEEQTLLQKTASGQPMWLETVRRRRDGTLVDVSIAATAVADDGGRSAGVGQIMRDISEQKRMQRELSAFAEELQKQVVARTAELQAEQHFSHSILDAVPVSIAFWDREQRCQFGNRAYLSGAGLTGENLRGRSLAEIAGPDMLAQAQPYFEGALAGREQQVERMFALPDGSTKYALMFYVPYRNDDQIQGLTVVGLDITPVVNSRKQLAAALRENKALLNALDEFALVSETDRRGRVIAVNDAFCAISGYRREEMLGQDHRIVASGIHPPTFFEGMWRKLLTGETWRGEICNRKRDGELFWVDCIISPFLREDRSIEKIVAIQRDITGIKRAVAAIDEQRQRQDFILRGTNAGTYEVNLQTGDMQVNERYWEMLGYSLQELQPMALAKWVDIAGPEYTERAIVAMKQYLQGEMDSFEFEWPVRHRDGHMVWIADSGRVATWTADGKPELMYGTHVDNTARRQAQEALQQAVIAANAANAAKSEFLANMSHEIRTPLNAVIGMAYVLGQSDLSEAQRAHLQKIQMAGHSLLAVINDVLDLSKIEAGQMQLESEVFAPATLLRELSGLMQAAADQKSIELDIGADESVPAMLAGDVTRIRQI